MNIFSHISGAHLVADTVHPRWAGSRRGRLAHDASYVVPLSRTVHSGFPLPFPAPQPASALARGREHIDPCPDLSGCTTMKMLMRSEVVVDGSDILQGSIARRGIGNRMLGEQPLHRADEPLDTAVLPRAARVAVLQANARTPQSQTKMPRGEHRFVVGAQHARAAILAAHGDEVVPDRQRRLVRQPLETQAGAAGMIDDRQREMLSAMGISLGQQVHPPDQIARHRAGDSMFEFSAGCENQLLMPTERTRHICFAHGHLPADREAPVEVMGDQAAPRVGHEGFQANQFISHPTRFGRRMGPSGRAAGAGTGPGGPWSRLYPSTQPMPQLGTPSNEPAQPMQKHSPPATSWITEWMAT